MGTLHNAVLCQCTILYITVQQSIVQCCAVIVHSTVQHCSAMYCSVLQWEHPTLNFTPQLETTEGYTSLQLHQTVATLDCSYTRLQLHQPVATLDCSYTRLQLMLGITKLFFSGGVSSKHLHGTKIFDIQTDPKCQLGPDSDEPVNGKQLMARLWQ